MKTAEEFISKWSNWWITNKNKNVLNIAFENELKEMIEQAQRESYNQALNDAAENVIMKLLNGIIVIDKDSILKLKK